MKKAISTTLLALALLAAALSTSATAEAPTAYNVLLAGGGASNVIRIWLTPDGRTFVIDSVVPLEAGGAICEHDGQNMNRLVCPAVEIASFEVNADGGDDQIRVDPTVTVPTTIRGGTGRDVIFGGSGDDKLVGGPGSDKIVGRDGDDTIVGGPGHDVLLGGRGADVIRGGPGRDTISGGPGTDEIFSPGYPPRG